MLGNPKYSRGDNVIFIFNNEKKNGSIVIVDAFGTFCQKDDVYYDILCEEEKVFYKHIIESDILDLRKMN